MRVNTKSKPTISIIGPGRVGAAIGVLAAKAGYQVAAVAGRDVRRTRAAARLIGRGVQAVSPSEAAAVGQIVLLTVPDAAIKPLCDELAAEGAFRRGTIVAHCCGALDSESLASARDLCGCAVASMHPLQTFPTPQAAVKSMEGVFFFAEGDKRALGELEKLAKAVGGVPVRIDPAAKAAYHAAACMASNYLVALMDAVLCLEEQVGLDRRTAWVALAPIVEATLNNITSLGPVKALTGPISRGDAETVAQHLAAVDGNKELSDLYRAMGRWTTSLAVRKGTIDKAQARTLKKLLGDKGQKK